MKDMPTHRVISTGEAVFPSGHDPEDLEPLPTDFWEEKVKLRAIEGIKAKAASRILAVAPEWKQRNDLFAIAQGEGHPGYRAALERWAEIEEIRADSNREEAMIEAGSGK